MKRNIVLRMLAGLVLLALTAGKCVPDVQVELPGEDDQPAVDVIEFTQEGDGWPPQVVGIDDIETVPYTAIPGALTQELEDQILESLSQDAEVQDALAERFTFLNIDQVVPEKSETFPSDFLVNYFSYARNATVRVAVRGEALERGEIETIEAATYQPAEGAEEIVLAIDLARESLINADFPVSELQGAAILAYPGETTRPFYDRRVLYVVFSEGEDSLPLYYALVDLTNLEVFEGGPVAGSLR